MGTLSALGCCEVSACDADFCVVEVVVRVTGVGMFDVAPVPVQGEGVSGVFDRYGELHLQRDGVMGSDRSNRVAVEAVRRGGPVGVSVGAEVTEFLGIGGARGEPDRGRRWVGERDLVGKRCTS